MRSIMDILLDDSDASIALSLAIAGVVWYGRVKKK